MALVLKNSVATSADLPLVGNVDGDIRQAADTLTAYIWNAGGSAWNLYGTPVPDLEPIDATRLVGAIRPGVQIALASIPAVGDITSVVAGTALTGGGTSGAVTLNANVGVGASQLVQRDGAGAYPAGAGGAITALNGSAVASGTVAAARLDLSNLNGSNVTSGTVAAARLDLSNLNGSNVTSGTVAAARLDLTGQAASNITTGTLATARLDVGTGANQLVQRSGSGAYPAGNGAAITGVVKFAEDLYDFAVNGGALGDHVLTTTVPANCVAARVFLIGKTNITGTVNDIGIKVGSLVLSSGALPGDINGVAFEATFAGVKRVTASGTITVTIAGGTITAGAFRILVEYIPYTL